MNYLRVLVALPDRDMAEALRDALNMSIVLDDGGRLVIHSVGHEKEALDYVHQSDAPYLLVITHLGLPQNARSPRNDKDQRGLLLLESLKTGDPTMHGVLISPIEEPSIFRRLQKCRGPIPE